MYGKVIVIINCEYNQHTYFMINADCIMLCKHTIRNINYIQNTNISHSENSVLYGTVYSSQ